MADSNPAGTGAKPRTNSMSQMSETSQTAAEFIKEQLNLEAEAREALPYQFDTCTRDLGPLRQSLYACLTCNPAPATPTDPYQPAAVCYSCSISCHGEHTLVELFNKRNFICDCGTTRIPETAPCTLRIDSKTGQKGGVVGEEPAKTNKYNHNFRNRFCGCGEDYDPQQEKGTMFQCLGLGTVEDGGCGEDWWHPECLVGYTREEYAKLIEKPQSKETETEMNGSRETNGNSSQSVGNIEANGDIEMPTVSTDTGAVGTVTEGIDGNDVAAAAEQDDDDDTPLPPGFPDEDDFDHFICYKCLGANGWLKQYAGTEGFLAPIYLEKSLNKNEQNQALPEGSLADSKKRKACDEDEESATVGASLSAPTQVKRQKSEDPSSALSSIPEDSAAIPTHPKKEEIDEKTPKHSTLPPLPAAAQTTQFSLFLKPDFRDHLCRCSNCFLLLKAHPQLLEEEDTYEPPVSDDGEEGAQSVGTGSLLDRGEAAFNNMDRVQAIQGAMAYAHLKDKVSAFLRPFAESGQAVGAEDIKAYFEKLRGDAQGIQDAAGGAKASRKDGNDGDGDDAEADGRREQSGY